MPGGDGTGPNGQGPMTGKGLGFCIVEETSDSSIFRGHFGDEGGMRQGCRFRGGRRGNIFQQRHNTPNSSQTDLLRNKILHETLIQNLEEEKEFLQFKIKEIAKELEKIKKRD